MPSNLNSSNIDPSTAAQELPLLKSNLQVNPAKSKRMQDNFGYSLLASYCENFVFELVLHATSDRSFLNNDGEWLRRRLNFAKHHSILDCPVEETVYIVADVDTL
jgi:hypothetical protein